MATLRDYLNCEYKAKIKSPGDHVFDRYNILGHSVKVPQQTNFTDCGLYVLQYVESFFTVNHSVCLFVQLRICRFTKASIDETFYCLSISQFRIQSKIIVYQSKN